MMKQVHHSDTRQWMMNRTAEREDETWEFSDSNTSFGFFSLLHLALASSVRYHNQTLAMKWLIEVIVFFLPLAANGLKIRRSTVSKFFLWSILSVCMCLARHLLTNTMLVDTQTYSLSHNSFCSFKIDSFQC